MKKGLLFELKRQVVHLLAGLFMAAAVYKVAPFIGDYIIVPLLAVVAGLYATPRIAAHLPLVSHLIDNFERERDKNKFPFKGAFWFNFGIIPPVMLLHLNVAVAIIVVLSVGDAASTVIGKTYGRMRIGDKSLEGLIAFLVFAGFAATALVPPQKAFALALTGGLIEFVGGFDDNFLIPVGLTAAALALGF